MQKLLTIILLIFTTNIIYAQEYSTSRLIGGEDNYYMHPVWSPDGSKIALTESNYKGLWVINSDGSNPIKITDEAAAGWGFEWSADSKSILSRVAKFVGPRRLNAVKNFNIENGNSNQLTEFKSFMPGLPHWVDDNRNVLIFNKTNPEKIKSGISIEDLKDSDFPQFTCFLKGNKIALYNNKTQDISTLDPLNSSGYLNPSVSKDGKNIVFEQYGGNLYVMNLDGSNLVDLGTGNYPDWSPDSKSIVYNIIEDDGHRFTSSDIFVINFETMEKINITNSNDKLEMHPNWSPDGKKIAFDESNTGMIFVVELTN